MKTPDIAIDFILTQDEKESKLWRRLLAYMEQRLEQARAMNDADRNEIETAKLRGRISELRGLVGLDTKVPVVDEPPR